MYASCDLLEYSTVQQLRFLLLELLYRVTLVSSFVRFSFSRRHVLSFCLSVTEIQHTLQIYTRTFARRRSPASFCVLDTNLQLSI